MTNIRSFFTFEFSDEELDKVVTYRFNIDGDSPVYRQFFRYYHRFGEKTGEMEKFGIHDCSAHPGDLEGFTSYEIPPEDYDKVMTQWRDWFVNAGFDVGPVFVVEIDSNGNEANVTDVDYLIRDQIWDKLDYIRDAVM